MKGAARRVCAIAIAGFVLGLVPTGASGAVREADGRLGEWSGDPTMLAGRTQISRGELIHTDYLYDDYGPDLNGIPDFPQFRDNLAPKSGDYGYPENPDRYGYNAADLRELRLAADDTGLHALIALQTMKVPDAAVVTIAIDTDGDAATGPQRWPDGVDLRGGGADAFITTWGSGARITHADGSAEPVESAANLEQNAIELDVPWQRLGQLDADARVWAVSGLANPDGTYRAQDGGGTPAFDLAFQGEESYDTSSHWGDRRQSSALADGDVSDFARPLAPRAMRRGQTVPFRLEPGFYNRIFRSAYTYGEGIELKQGESSQGSARPMFLGRFQPYGLYVPEGYSQQEGAPLLIDGHSLDVNHNEYIAVGEGQLPELGDERGSLIITPLARGIDTWYLDSGLIDVFEAWRDVRRNYGADPERTSLTGYSMGGYLTYRLGLLMPDAFVRTSVYVGPPAYYLWPYPLPLQSTDEWRVAGNTRLIAANGLNLPFEINHGNLDELVPIGGVLHQVDAFKAAGNPYRFYHHAADDHFGFIAIADRWTHTARWLGTGPRERRPVRVRYVRYPAMDLPHANLVWDGAYWVDGMQVRDADSESDHGKVDATTFALGGREPRLVTEPRSTSAGEGGISPATVTGQHYEPGAPIEERNAFEAELRSLSGILLRTRRMGLDPAETVRAQLSGDGVTVLSFSDRWPEGLGAWLDGSPVPVERAPDGSIALRLNLAGGTAHELLIRGR